MATSVVTGYSVCSRLGNSNLELARGFSVFFPFFFVLETNCLISVYLTG